MDYNRAFTVSGAKDYPRVHVALLMVPGRNHTNNGNYSKSPLLLNPGGPGGSGVMFAASAGFQIQNIVGLDQDIIGFDPRGIGETTPLVDCWAFPGNSQSKDHDGVSQDDVSHGWAQRVAWALTGWEVPLVNSTKESLEKLDRRARLVGDLCQTKDGLYGNDSILRHVSTPAVARDMLSIVDAWDAWREEEEKTGRDKNLAMGHFPEEIEEDPNLDTKGKLVYWGFSYGTLLGATFAAMFPDRVGRLILDGVVDADFYISPFWIQSLLNTDAVEASFFKYCHEAGTRCAIYREGDSEADIRARVYDIAYKLKSNPVHGINAKSHTPAIITYEILKSIMFISLYFPLMTFPAAALLLDLFYRNDVEVLMSVFVLPPSIDIKPYCAGFVPPGYQVDDAQKAIMCSDKRYPVSFSSFAPFYGLPSPLPPFKPLTTKPQLNETVPDLQTHFENMANISSYADIWMTLMIGCSGWSITATDPPMRWDDHPSHRQKPIKTSFPLLFISNTADPVTPLYAGVKMARKFVNAGLIEQLSEGHCSISGRSLCTMMKIRQYLSEGKVPPVPEWGPDGKEVADGKWERCKADAQPWMASGLGSKNPRPRFSNDPHAEADEVVVTEEVRMLEAWRNVNKVASQMKFWGMKDMGIQLDWEKLRELEEMRLSTL